MRIAGGRSSLLLLAALTFVPSNARADYDVSGRWGVFAVGAHWDIVQAGSDLEYSVVGSPAAPVHGTIDLGTGAMQFDIPPPPYTCGAYSLTGFASADGKSFTLTRTTNEIRPAPAPLLQCREYVMTLDGSRCGNGLLDAGESCDDGRADDGDCCSSTCSLDSSGTTCGADNELCTDDVCDGAGTCTHPFNTAPCADDRGCGKGSCSNGACVLTSFEPAGTSCDLDDSACSIDTCDGAGACTTGEMLDCAPCGICHAETGCVIDAAGCGNGVAEIKLTIADRARLDLDMFVNSSGDPAGSAGDPTTTMSYTLCLGQIPFDSLWAQPFYEGTVGPGGTCDGRPCWQGRSGKFLYKDRAESAAGIGGLRVDVLDDNRLSRTHWRGKGANLAMPAGFIPQLTSITAKVVADDGVTSRCWSRTIKPLFRYGAGVKVKGTSTE